MKTESQSPRADTVEPLQLHFMHPWVHVHGCAYVTWVCICDVGTRMHVHGCVRMCAYVRGWACVPLCACVGMAIACAHVCVQSQTLARAELLTHVAQTAVVPLL